MSLVSSPVLSVRLMDTAGCGSVSDSVRGYPLRAFVICLIAYTTAQMDLALFSYAVTVFRAEFGLTLSEVMAIVSAVFLLGDARLGVLGWLADRVGRLPLFHFSLLGSSLLVALIGIAPGVATLTALRGASIGVGVPLALARFLYLNLDSLLSGLKVEDIANRIGKEAQPSHG
jgi:MFS family permease